MAAGDFDADGIDEILLSYQPLLDAYQLHDFATAAAEWISPPELGDAVIGDSADITGDGRPDFAFVTEDGGVVALDAFGNSVLWRAEQQGFGVDIVLTDIDGNPVAETIAATRRTISMYSSSGTPVASIDFDENVVDLAIGDTDDDDAPEIWALVGAPSPAYAQIHRLDGELRTVSTFDLGAPATSLALTGIATNGERDLAVYLRRNPFGSKEGLSVRDAATGVELWRSPALLGSIPANGIHFFELPGSGEAAIAIAGQFAMYVTR